MRSKDKKLRAVIETVSGLYEIPNLEKTALRQFRGWDPRVASAPDLRSDAIGPGPTLRARLGDRVEISFLNKIDDTRFPYTFVKSDKKPGLSSNGCDESLPVYPGKDKYPNCFHGSSTANLHFHGTHTSPEGLADNVLVQVLPQLKSADADPWVKVFNEQIFSRPFGSEPQHWKDLPQTYTTWQEEQVKKYDLAYGTHLFHVNQQSIDAGLWPEYLVGAFPNMFEIPECPVGAACTQHTAGQAPGTHWYHAHKHGSTSLHILSGLSGAFVIESSQPDGYDQVIRRFYGWGDAYGAHEKILVFQQIDPTQNLERANAQRGKGSQQILVNGRLTPVITMRPGEVQLWRFVNATEGNNGGLLKKDLFQTPGFEFRQTAEDGVQLSPANYKSQPFLTGKIPNAVTVDPNPETPGLMLSGGNRADLLVRAPMKAVRNVPFKTGGKVLFYVTVAGSETSPRPLQAFPTVWAAMPAFLADLAAPGEEAITNPGSPVKFQWEAGRINSGNKKGAGGLAETGYPPHFMINNKQFGETGALVDQCMPLGETQDWIVENYTSIAHPFHIHVNPFQVMQIESPSATCQCSTTVAPKDNWIWQDVVALPPAVISSDGKTIIPSRVRIRHKFADYTGTFVLHCHILAHEDRGMMELVRVVPASQYPGACQGNISHHH